MIRKLKNVNKFFWLLFAGAFLLILFWTGGYYIISSKLYDIDVGQISREPYKEHYAFIAGDYRDEFWKNVYAAAQKEGEKNNVYVELFGENLQKSYSIGELFEIAINSNVDGIIINPNDKECAAGIERARKKGIPVVTVLDDCKSDGQICFVGISRYNQGVEYGKQILDMGIKKAQEVVVLLEDNEQLEKQKLVVAGIRNKLQGHDIELRTERLRTRSTFHTEEDIRNIIVNAERRPDVFICLTSDDTLHTIQQIVEYNQVGQIKIIGYFDSEEAREAISKQIMYSVIGVNGSHMGEQAVQAIINYKNHQKISAVYDIDFYRVNYMDVNGNQGDS